MFRLAPMPLEKLAQYWDLDSFMCVLQRTPGTNSNRYLALSWQKLKELNYGPQIECRFGT